MDALDQCCSSELVTGKSDLKQASLCEGLGGQKMREAEGRSSRSVEASARLISSSRLPRMLVERLRT